MLKHQNKFKVQTALRLTYISLQITIINYNYILQLHITTTNYNDNLPPLKLSPLCDALFSLTGSAIPAKSISLIQRFMMNKSTDVYGFILVEITITTRMFNATAITHNNVREILNPGISPRASPPDMVTIKFLQAYLLNSCCTYININ